MIRIDSHFKPDLYMGREHDEFIMELDLEDEAEFVERVKILCPSVNLHTRIPYGLYRPLVIGLTISSTQDVMAFLLAWA